MIKICVHDMFSRRGTADAFQVYNELTLGTSLPPCFQLVLYLVSKSSKQSGRSEITWCILLILPQHTNAHTHTHTCTCMRARADTHTHRPKISLVPIMLVGGLAVHLFPARL